MKRFLLSLISIGFSLLIGATDILIETEAFQNKGGWAVDQQFMNLMGSPYLLAHGLGTPVADATTILSVKKGGRYRVYVRTYNWTAPFSGGKKGPGAFQLTIGENFRSEQLGTIGHGWYWQEAGQVELEKRETKLALHDLTGFDGRCDAILLTTSKTFNPNAVAQPTAWRRSLQKVQADQSQTFDLVVVGGGIAGMCAAMAAARQHLRVALVNDRFVLGGNNSSEVRVHLSGVSETGKYPRLGRMIREFGHTRSGNAMPAEYYEDQKKDSFILSEKNITLFAGFRAIDVKTTNNRIDHVVIEQIETAQRIVLEAGLFSDCTGDGTIGALAGADYSMGREARYEYNESLAPEYADTLVMGSSLQWYSKPTDKPVAFPLFEYGMAFNEQNAQFVTNGEWTWETGMNKNQITQAEQIRDYGMFVVYSNWSFLKNRSKRKDKYARRQLDWLGYVQGKRESRRLLGDYVLTQNDIDNNIQHKDASFCTTWAIDLHFPDPANTKYFPGEEFKTRTVHNWIHPYDVPYRCLYSRNISNLFMAGRNISCTHVALGTIRVMRTTGMMGEVVGMAASLCHKYGVSPRGVYERYIPELQQLMQAGAGAEDAPDNQRFNAPNIMLDQPKKPSLLQGYAQLNDDTLRMGNDCMERIFLWNGGDLKTIGVLNKKNGRYLSAQGKNPDMLMVKGEARDGHLETEAVVGNSLHNGYLSVKVSFSKGKLDVIREYRIYDDVAAIACQTYLRGQLEGQQTEKEVSGADRKNIESTADMSVAVKVPVLDRLELDGHHWQTRTVEFLDYTDWNNNLVSEHSFIPYRESSHRGNLLFAKDGISNDGFFFLKEAPCSSTQLQYPGYDFRTDFGTFKVTGTGLAAKDVSPTEWVPTYGVVLGVYDGSDLDALTNLRGYQKQARICQRANDEMVMLNTWGDRSQDSKIDEAFCLAELDKAARLGVSVFQLDDGWQIGKSPNSKVAKGSFNDIWKQADYWMPDTIKFPNCLTPIVEKGRQLGIRVGLWYNPSIQNDFADWQKDADAILALWKQYGITIFKIDGLQIPTKRAEQNLRKLFDKVMQESHQEVMFNLDATAGRRGGYHMFAEYGNVFLENRYTDWGNYYPYQTLRNLWQLSRYVPTERLQVEFLNKWRNEDKYPENDVFAPHNYRFDYLFAVAMAGQPLAWMEAQNLPDAAFDAEKVVKQYRKVQEELHKGCILPIGNEPDGRSWTGFQSILNDKEGFLLVFREDNEANSALMKTWLKEGDRLLLQPVFGTGASTEVSVEADGKIRFSLPEKNDYQLYRYHRK